MRGGGESEQILAQPVVIFGDICSDSLHHSVQLTCLFFELRLYIIARKWPCSTTCKKKLFLRDVKLKVKIRRRWYLNHYSNKLSKKVAVTGNSSVGSPLSPVSAGRAALTARSNNLNWYAITGAFSTRPRHWGHWYEKTFVESPR